MGTVAAALVAAGCGTASAAHQGASAGGGSLATGCAAVNEATSLTVHQTLGGKAPASGPSQVTQKNVLVVHSLFGELCAAVTHPDTSHIRIMCPNYVGPTYTGTFYDGTRELAKFSYTQAGCANVSLTAGGKVHNVRVTGTAAEAAPHLISDLSAAMKA